MGTLQYFNFAIHRVRLAAYGNGTAAASWVTCPTPKEGTLTLEMGESEVMDGEGVLEHIWYHTQRANGTLRFGRGILRAVELITGNGASSLSDGTESMTFGTDDELTPPPFRIEMVAKALNASSEAEGYMVVYGYKATGRLDAINLAETTPGEWSFTFRLLKSTRDTEGNSIAAAYGRYVVIPSSLPSTEP